MQQICGNFKAVSKAEAIRTLLATTDLSMRQIAETVGCRRQYVSSVQHRLGRDYGETHTARWVRENRDKRRAYERVYRREYRARIKAEAQL